MSKEETLSDIWMRRQTNTHGRKIQGVEAPKVLAHPPRDNSVCLNFLFKIVLSTYEKCKWRYQSNF